MLSITRLKSFKIIILIAIMCVGGLLALNRVSAADDIPDITYTPEVPLPGVFDKSVTVSNDLIGTYIKALYVYFIWAVGAIAVVMIVLGGIKWVAAAGNAARINDARDTINSAIIGVIVALTSVVLLNLISPQFTIFKLPDLKNVTADPLALGTVSKICDMIPVVRCGDTKKIGTSMVDGKETDNYCLGTSCPLTDLNTKKYICSIDIDSKGNYYVLNGCINEITYENGVTTTVDSGVIGELPITNVKCGNISVAKMVGVRCDVTYPPITEDNLTLADVKVTDPACYLLGPKAIFVDNRLGTADVVANACCPGDPCPSNKK